ncbi:MAG: hypothetical protein RIS47_363, partial [Bacteroidota bacterium]
MHNQIFDTYPVYTNRDLGVFFRSSETCFRVWSPKATAVELRIYREDSGDNLVSSYELETGEHGVWQIVIPGNW